ncbi:ABC transporter substrate-binding protein [Streptacidiphilus fuscans]|uniref:ABC transporter substrate-binding protein n=1 Tax=Streptacidiphilus fuscans TaxID=2789292 RepID=A0A931AZZ8_9ACTN|nr:ABC transporter substrate-binding protein [Streptacidiphilus fuscans]MBF9066607.1 ABC transporter substrate-binding protein [Streptacidiphilus fuscans]
MRRKTLGTAAAATLALALTLTGCSGASANHAAASTLTVNLGYSGTTITQNFNPFSPQATQGTMGFQYESLFNLNILQGGKFIPWLVTDYTWSNGGKQITLRLDPRANWSDGSPLTADDVVFTLNYAKQNKLPVAWAFTYDTATAVDAHTVSITFGAPAYALLSSIGNVTPVPKKIWQDKNPTTFTNPNPVASGPYTLQQYSAQQLTFQARGNYWKTKDVPVKTVYAPVVTSASEVGKLLSGEEDWSGGNVPDVKKQFVAVDPTDFHAWYPTYGGDFIFFNLTKAPFDNVDVRQGISAAVNRTELAQLGNPGMFSPLNLTGLDPVTQGTWIAPQFANAVQPTPDLAKADAAFAKAGYTMQGGKLVGPDGKQLSFTITEESDFADSVQRDKVLADELNAAGMNVQVDAIPAAQLAAKRQSADFDVVVGGAVYYATPYGFYHDMLFSGNAGIWTNYGHYVDKQTDALLNQLGDAGDTTSIKSMSAQLEQLMVDQVPAAPLDTIGVSAEYSTKNWTGWPTAQNPYAQPAPWAGPVDVASILLSLRPAKG